MLLCGGGMSGSLIEAAGVSKGNWEVDMKADVKKMPVAEYWEKSQDGIILCRLCPHHCRLKEGQTGICRVRAAQDGELKALGYGLVSAAHIDPIEKKPLYHFYPGAPVYSIGGWGCNFGCGFCQNWTISQRMEFHGVVHTPRELVGKTMESGCQLIAYTYNEPMVGFEFVRDCSRLARDKGLKNILVTNGYIEREPAEALLPLVDALNVDVKSMSDEFYRKQCRGTLAPVLEFCALAHSMGRHVEITNLVIPGLNDSDQEFEQLAQWVNAAMGDRVPLHLSAYHPDYKVELPATSASTLMRAAGICRRYLKYVYIGNLALGDNRTTCPGCGETLIIREGYRTRLTGIRGGVCANCGQSADVVV